MQKQPTSSSFSNPSAKKYRSLISTLLDCDLPRSALFYAERYFYSMRDAHDARHLFATSLFGCDQVHSAQNLVSAGGCPECSRIFAQCCLKLGRFREGQDALAECLNKDPLEFLPSEPRATPDESVLLCQAGSLALKGNMPDLAAQHYLKALALNPFLWEAIEGLCHIGCCPEIDTIIPPSSLNNGLTQSSLPHIRFTGAPTSNGLAPQPSGSGFFTPAPDPTKRPTGPVQPNTPAQAFRLDPVFDPSSYNGRESLAGESGFNGDVTFAAGGLVNAPYLASKNDGDARTSHKRTRAQMASGSNSSLPKLEKKPSRGAAEGALAVFRRSTRLLGGASKNSIKAPPREKRRTRARSRSHDMDDMDEDMQPVESTSSTSSAVHSPREFSPGPSQPPPLPPGGDEYSRASATILDMTRKFAKVYRALTMYEPQAALDAIEQLPADQTQAPWVSALVGRARFEMADYVQASRAFEQARTLDPYRMWDMDVYSTVLWHLQSDVQLSFLAQELVSVDERSPQAWIATGNCFSLQKDHSQALTCFKRATQLDPRCAYGYALSGHEALAMDDHESAMQFFRTSLKTDGRHYPAWYGLGNVYLRQNKLRKAEYHFRKAIEISPSNAVLISCEGTALEKRGVLDDALERFNRALALSPTSALIKHKRMKVLIRLKQYENALKDLQELRDLAPDEANVPFALGKLYSLMGRSVDAVKAFTEARDLDPKLSAIIGHLMEEMANSKAESSISVA